MKTYKKIVTTEEPLLLIEYEEGPESPREDTNLGYFITVDRNYYSPDENEELQQIIKAMGYEAKDVADHMELITKKINEETDEKVMAIYLVAKYEHSGVVYSLGSKHGFDFSNNGFYIVTDKTQKEHGAKKKDFEMFINEEINMYNKYVNGEILRFTLFDKDGEVEDSCCGFYDVEHIREYLPKEWKKEDLNEYIKN